MCSTFDAEKSCSIHFSLRCGIHKFLQISFSVSLCNNSCLRVCVRVVWSTFYCCSLTKMLRHICAVFEFVFCGVHFHEFFCGLLVSRCRILELQSKVLVFLFFLSHVIYVRLHVLFLRETIVLALFWIARAPLAYMKTTLFWPAFE